MNCILPSAAMPILLRDKILINEMVNILILSVNQVDLKNFKIFFSC